MRNTLNTLGVAMLLFPFLYVFIAMLELVLLDGDTLALQGLNRLFNNDPIHTGIPNIVYGITALILAEIDRDYITPIRTRLQVSTTPWPPTDIHHK